ncbi:MAG: RimK domain-containing protein ATP-grasp [Actinomycetota bacterium]|nr:RimK domain-containing protein ATP-grasp [Actinomycetota bacterium]
MTRPVLLWGISTDGPLAVVRTALAEMGVPVVFVDQHAAPATAIRLDVGEEMTGTLSTPTDDVALENVGAAYVRPYDLAKVLAVDGVSPGTADWDRAVAIEDVLVSWSEMTAAFVVNRPSAMASNNSKPFQAGLIRKLGFDVPDTLVTTDPDAAVHFWRRHGSVVYKSVSGVRSIVAQLGESDRPRLNDIGNCPTQFQQYIAGVDLRVHVVGEEIFSCEVRSDGDDYRYPSRQGGSVAVTACTLPEDVAHRCRVLATMLALPVAGIDLRRTSSGAWFCFEVNPSPGFNYYEEETGLPIGAAIAQLLAAGAKGDQFQLTSLSARKDPSAAELLGSSQMVLTDIV